MMNDEGFPFVNALGDTIREYFQHSMPKRVWHYTNVPSLVGICESNEFWLSDHRAVNDRSEIAMPKTKISKLLSKKASLGGDHLIDSSFENDAHQNSIRHPVYLGSFSMAKDLLSQWKGYANVHTGVAISFNLQSLLVHAREQNFLLSKVSYNEAEMDRIIDYFVNKTVAYAESQPDQVKANSILSYALMHIFIQLLEASFKGSKWKEEREVRIICLSGTQSPHYRISNEKLLSYIPIKIDPTLCINEVILLDKDPYQAQVLREYLNSKNLDYVKIGFSALNMKV